MDDRRAGYRRIHIIEQPITMLQQNAVLAWPALEVAC